ncbi:MAG: hypothetical protein HYX68_26200 [Planctomycetes bacterium]|nr:hypothetical protein [Planctomycetota bacterium]
MSVYDRPENLDRFGGAFLLTNVPESVQIIQQGRDPTHYEIVPASPMTMDDYEEALSKIVLVKASEKPWQLLKKESASISPQITTLKANLKHLRAAISPRWTSTWTDCDIGFSSSIRFALSKS